MIPRGCGSPSEAAAGRARAWATEAKRRPWRTLPSPRHQGQVQYKTQELSNSNSKLLIKSSPDWQIWHWPFRLTRTQRQPADRSAECGWDRQPNCIRLMPKRVRLGVGVGLG
jgi:hypothetical protein